MNNLDKAYELKERIERSLAVYNDVPAYLIEEYNEVFNLLNKEEQSNILIDERKL